MTLGTLGVVTAAFSTFTASDDDPGVEENDPLYARVPVWLILTPLPGAALKIYAYLSALVSGNDKNKPMVKPTDAELCSLLDEKEESIRTGYLALVMVGALRETGGGGYRLYFEAPAAYEGPRSLTPKHW